MKRENSVREKGRAVFMAALMVLSVVAMSSAFAGGAAAAHNEDASVDINSADRLYQGQVAEADNVTPLGDSEPGNGTVDLYQGSSNDQSNAEWVREVDVENGEIAIDTDTLDSGSHYVDTGNGTLDFTVRIHSLDASVEEDRMTNVGGSSSETELTIDSPRSSFHATVSADGLDSDDLRTLFNVPEGQDQYAENNVVAVNDEEDTIVVDARGNYDLNLEGVAAGDYTLTVESTDTTAEDEVPVEVIDEDIEVAFAESAYVEDRSNIAEITVDLENTDTAYVTIGNAEDVNFESVVEVTDENGDGEATVLVDTTSVHQLSEGDQNISNDEITAAGDDSVALEEVAAGGLENPLAAGDYELSVATSAPFDENEEDTAYLTLEDREALAEDAVETHTAPDSVSSSDDLEETTVTSTNQIANGDELLVTVETKSLFAYFDGAEDFGDVNNELSLEIEEQDSSPNADPFLWSTDGGDENISNNVTIVEANQSEGEVVLSVDYDSFENSLENDGNYDIRFDVDGSNDFATNNNDETAANEFVVEEPYLEWSDSAESVPNSEEAELTGETNVAPGSEITTRARAPGAFVLTADAEVEHNENDERVFAATYNFSEYDAGTEFSLDADGPHGISASTSSVLTEEADPAEFSVDADAPGQVEVDEDASLDVTVTNDGEEAGNATLEATVGDENYTEELEIDGGESATESFNFDTSEEGDIEWSVTTGDDEASGTLTVEEAAENGTENGDELGDENDTEDDDGLDNGIDDENNTENGDESPDDGEDSESTPGFGVGVALVALLAAGMLALRRDN